MESATPAPSRFGSLEATSTVMREAFTLLKRLAPTQVTVVFVGESGTGKGLLAREAHATSPRSHGPFVTLDCGAIDADQVETELFGQEIAGSKAAPETHAGALERASAGTLFLRQVGQLPLEVQPRLLRALEKRAARRVGGKKDYTFDTRLIASSSGDLNARVASGHFREDLYFALSGAVVVVPPLRERAGDMPLLVKSVLASLGHSEVAVDGDVLASLAQRAWPGNVRELKSTLACALAFVEDGVLQRRHLQLAPPSDNGGELERLPLGGQPLEKLERVAIKQTLAQMRGVKSQAAQALGIAVSTLYEKLKKYGL